MLSKNSQTYMACDRDYDEAEIVLFGAPFDSTTSNRPGARFASRVMRAESWGLESYSPYQDLDLTESTRVCDLGDLELSFGESGLALAQIERTVEAILNDGKLPCMIGGEHLVTLGAVRAAARRIPGLAVVHLDAHTDLRQDYLGAELSHATVMRRVYELLGEKSIFQFGIRSGEREEFLFAKAHLCTRLHDLKGIERLEDELSGRPVYLSIDLDVLDPSVFPGTGTPEPGGISYAQLQEAILHLGRLNVIGFDLVELSPPYDPSGISAACACKALRELLLSLSKSAKAKQ
ncbi:MAG: agmatinase [Christensenellaceae bacterium]|jgi:agmatinase|nr:agmatinase [Christensenellaceae bacterium]